MRRASLFLLLGALGCSGGGRTAPADLPQHSLAFGGDLIMGRGINRALSSEEERARLLADIAPILKGADLALGNAEGVIAGGGAFADKGESRPHMYRAGPHAVDALTAAGIDIVTVGNNHSGDYGPEALWEMTDRLLMAGIDYAGGGSDAADARRPVYRVVGDTVVAVVGGDLTIAQRYQARAHLPGALWLPGLEAAHEDEVVEALSAIAKEARAHAHVVLLSPHWGDNYAEAPTPLIRRMARRLIAAGYDGILGHSAHVVHGVELIDGKPVLYDAGNMLSDYSGGEGGMLYELGFTRAGLTSIAAHPIDLKANLTLLSSGRAGKRVLEAWKTQSEGFGTAVRIEEGVGRIDCDPGEIFGPEGSPEPPHRAVPAAVHEAPRDLLVDALPEGVTPLSVRWANGVELIGVELAVQDLSVPKAGQIVSLYWRTSAPITADLEIRLEGHGHNEKGSLHMDRQDHLPGDWLLPTPEWPVGKIIVDRTLLRLMGEPVGTVEFKVGLLDGRHPLAPQEVGGLPEEAKLVTVGQATYKKGVGRLFEQLRGQAAEGEESGAEEGD